jgi:hypothetical protein
MKCQFPSDDIWTEIAVVLYYGEQELKREVVSLDYKQRRVFFLKK